MPEVLGSVVKTVSSARIRLSLGKKGKLHSQQDWCNYKSIRNLEELLSLQRTYVSLCRGSRSKFEPLSSSVGLQVDRYEEYPKMRELIQRKDDLVAQRATPPYYLNVNALLLFYPFLL